MQGIGNAKNFHGPPSRPRAQPSGSIPAGTAHNQGGIPQFLPSPSGVPTAWRANSSASWEAGPSLRLHHPCLESIRSPTSPQGLPSPHNSLNGFNTLRPSLTPARWTAAPMPKPEARPRPHTRGLPRLLPRHHDGGQTTALPGKLKLPMRQEQPEKTTAATLQWKLYV